MKKVIFFIPSACGGAERQAVVISRCLPDKEFLVSYHLFGPENQLKKFLPKNRIAVFHEEPKFTHKLLFHLWKIIHSEKPDIVYGAGMPVNWRLILASRFSKCKIILRNENYLYTQSAFQKLRLAITYPFADFIIAQTDEMRDGLVKGLHLSKKHVRTISNAIDKQYISQCISLPSPYTDTVHVRFVAVGRFHPVKGFDMLVKAFKSVRERISNAELYIVGKYDNSNEVYKEIMNYVMANGLGNCVFCVGFKDNPYVYMKYADCFVLSSRNEGLPNVMIEALYLGTPVAAMKCIPVIERIVDEGGNGFLAAKNCVGELAEAMQKACMLGRIKTTYNKNSENEFYGLFSNL